ncbi:hypothetical protein CH381_29555 [Leptospira sp. mixed culture ATI2-C-A1]|nr:hypothetical protein CH381_29555 [Leptospira sp. mixed culture ATI2-C-A1]
MPTKISLNSFPSGKSEHSQKMSKLPGDLRTYFLPMKSSPCGLLRIVIEDGLKLSGHGISSFASIVERNVFSVAGKIKQRVIVGLTYRSKLSLDFSIASTFIIIFSSDSVISKSFLGIV